jgi:sulfotransferase
MSKTYHFLSGLPRSGNTLLSAILNQNPDIYSSPLSPLSTLMWDYANSCSGTEYISRNKENEIRATKLISSVFDTFYKNVDKPVIIDREKSWGTPGNLNLIKEYITPNPKIIFTVRDILQIMSSFIKMDAEYIKTGSRDYNSYINTYRSKKDVESEYLMRTGGDIDKALLSLSSAFFTENKGIFHIVEYDDLILKPEETMSGIYSFLDMPDYSHDFKNIKKVEVDNDKVLGLPSNLHDVRKSISKSSNSIDILSDYIKHKYSNMEFWRDGSLMKVRGKDF